MSLGDAMDAEEAARWLDEIMEPSEPEELIRLAAAWAGMAQYHMRVRFVPAVGLYRLLL